MILLRDVFAVVGACSTLTVLAFALFVLVDALSERGRERAHRRLVEENLSRAGAWNADVDLDAEWECWDPSRARPSS